MADGLLIPDDCTIDILPIHFDVPEHYIPLKTFIETAAKTETIIGAMNADWFDGSLEYEVVVIPPKPGTFLIGLGLVVSAVSVATWSFLHSDVGKAFIKGLTGEEPKHWAEKAGEQLAARLKRKKPEDKQSDEAEAPVQPVQLKAVEPVKPEDLQRATTSVMLVETTRAILIKDQSELRRIGLSPERFREGFEARNEFYRACAEEQNIRAIGFDETDSFPIERKDFARLQVALAPREEAVNTEPWIVETTVLKVTSPNWDRNDESRLWKAKDPAERTRNFKVEDQGFWAMVGGGQLNLQGIDTIKVQWAYQGDGKVRKNFRVLRVIEYNGDKLAEPLSSDALNSIVGPHSFEGRSGNDLFGSR